jgi:ABC-type glycerol-3-phosphate transport system permease component
MRMRRREYNVILRAVVWLVLLCGAALFLFPFFWTVTTALKTYEQANAYPPVWIPRPLQWSNFAEAWTILPQPFHVFVLNTYLITVLSTLGTVLSSSLVAYGFARLHFRGRNVLFLVMLSTMMLPSQVTMIPVFVMWNKLHLVDTFAPLILPSWFASAFSVFLLRQFFMTLPRELDEAAMIDGCSHFGIWLRIIMPLSRPALTTIVILSFLDGWNDFMGPLIYLNSLQKYTVSIALNMFQDQFYTRLDLMMAASLIHIVPVIIIFFAAQKYFIKGIAMTGLKA